MLNEIFKYIQENSSKVSKELGVLVEIRKLQKVLPAVIVILFLIGAYVTYKTPTKASLPEGFVSIEPDAQQAQK